MARRWIDVTPRTHEKLVRLSLRLSLRDYRRVPVNEVVDRLLRDALPRWRAVFKMARKAKR